MSEPTTEAPPSQTLGCWCVLEIMGHRRLAGYVTEVTIAGAGFLRIDRVDGQTQFYPPASVYAITPSTEEHCKRYTDSGPLQLRAWSDDEVEGALAEVPEECDPDDLF